MGFLRRVFGRGADPVVGDPAAASDGTRPPVERLLEDHGLRALDRQLHLQDLLGEADWLLDQDAGTITFGGGEPWPAQVLGTESDADASWLWAWANPSVPAALTSDARAVMAYGASNGIDQFGEAKVKTGGILSGETFAMIAAGLLDADGYYRGPFDGGAVFVILRLPADVPRQVHGDGLRAVRTLSYAPLALPIGLTRGSLERYLAWIGLTVDPSGQSLVARDAAGQSVTIEFDRHGRMGRLSSTIQAVD